MRFFRRGEGGRNGKSSVLDETGVHGADAFSAAWTDRRPRQNEHNRGGYVTAADATYRKETLSRENMALCPITGIRFPKRCPLLSARTDAGHHLYNHYGQSTHMNFARNLPHVNEMTVHPDVILTRSPDNVLLLRYPRTNEVRLLCENHGTAARRM